MDGLTCDGYVVGNATEYLKNIAAGAAAQSYTFLHIDLLDARGHGQGWCSEQYLDGVDIVDDWVAQLLDAVDDEDGEEWLVGYGREQGGLEQRGLEGREGSGRRLLGDNSSTRWFTRR